VEKLKFGPGYQESGLVFTLEDGSPIHPVLFSQAFEGNVARAELTPIRFHDLRHTYATLALQAGIHVKVVSERLGHASVGFTLDIYSHAIPAMQEEAAETFAALVAD
jgi:integrase